MKRKKNPTKVEIEAKQAFVKMQERLNALPKFGDKYKTTKPVKSAVKKKAKPKVKVLTHAERVRQDLNERVANARSTPSLKTSKNSTGSSLPERYTGELKEREKKAREVKHVVAPIANKMGYGLITNPEHLKTMGRKS